VNTFIPTQSNGYPLIFGGDVPAPGFNSSESRYQHLPISLFNCFYYFLYLFINFYIVSLF